MTREEAIKVLNMVESHGLADEAKKMAIKALSQEQQSEWERDHEILKAYADGQESMKPCKDAISRQQCIDAVYKILAQYVPKIYLYTLPLELEKAITNLPSVSAEKIGQWIEVDVRNCHATLKCSVCDRVIKPTFTFGEYSYEDIKKFYPYCHCGAKMEAEE